MIQVSLKSTLGTSTVLMLPSDLSEFPLKNKVSFDVASQLLSNHLDSDNIDDSKSVLLMLNAVSDALDVDKELLLATKVNLNDLHNYKGLEDSILSVYNYLLSLSEQYVFEFKDNSNYKFKYKGRNFEIPRKITSNVLGDTFSDFSVIQAVEILNTKRYLSKVDLNDASFGDISYTSFLKIMALTVREKGVSIPSESSLFDAYINDLIILFSDVDTKTAYDIIFFLIIITLNYQN